MKDSARRNLSLREMSLITGQSKNTIAVQVHRGLEKLNKLMQPDFEEHPASFRKEVAFPPSRTKSGSSS